LLGLTQLGLRQVFGNIARQPDSPRLCQWRRA
jgi:hypothetical protein